jgi:transcriptional regulator with XRE-family HTH domain
VPKKIKTESVEPIEKFLRNARKSKGLSLENAAHDTRIRKIHLKQFETKVPDELDVYQIGYLRLYSRYLGVDIQPYLDAHKAKARGQTAKDIREKPANLAKFITLGFGSTRALLVALALLLALISLVVTHRKKHEVAPSTAQDAPSSQPNIIVASDRYTHILTNYFGKVKVVANIATVFTLVNPVHNNTIASGTLKAGEELTLPDAESIIIKTTIPDALDIQEEKEMPADPLIQK